MVAAHLLAMSGTVSSALARFRASLRRINWRQSSQSLANGAGNTIGTVLVYSIVVLIVFVWYRNTKKSTENGSDQKDSNGDRHSILESAIAFSKPAAALRTASQSFGTSGEGAPPTMDPQHAWI